MKTTIFGRTIGAAAAAATLALACIAPSSALAQSDPEAWKWRATIYGWFPDVDGTTTMPADSGGTSVSADIGDILSALDFVFMGQLEARKGRWGGFTDLVYLDLSNDKSATRALSFSGPGGNINIPANVSMNADVGLKGTVWTLAGTYTAVEKPGYEMLALGGFRYLTLETKINWQATGNIGSLPPVVQAGNTSAKPKFWDAIIGVRGRADIGQSKWYVPYYADVGTGDSDLTWQAAAGVGYRFGWGEVTAVYRHLDYKFKSGAPIQNLEFSGPAIGASWRW